MPVDEFNPWETSSGMLEGYDSVKVTDASFGYNPENTNDPEKLYLFLDILTTDPENGEGGVVREQYTVGNAWKTPDRGATAVHDSGKPTKFNNNSGIGLLTDSLVEALGMDGVRKLGDPKEADTWRKLPALKFHRKEFSMKPQDGGDEIKYSRMLVVEALDASATGKDAAASSPAAAGAADASAAIDAAAGAAGAVEYDCPPVLRVKLKKIASEAASFDAFAEAAFAVDGVTDVSAMEELVADEGFYAWLKG